MNAGRVLLISGPRVQKAGLLDKTKSYLEAEKIKVDDQDEQAEIQRRAAEMGVPPSRLQLKAEGRAALRQRIREDKVVALLAASANFQ